MKHSGLQRARQSTRKKMKKSLGPDFVDPSNLGLHGKETSSDIRCDICHEGLPINSKKDCITCKKCAIRAHANCVRTQLNVKYIKSLWLCVNCRHCYECDKSGVEQSELVFCRSCDRSYHYDCTEDKGIHNNGKYVCYRCAKPPVISTRLSTTPRQNSSTTTTATTTPTTSATTSSSTSVPNTTTTSSANATPNGNSSRVTARTVNKIQPIEGKSSNTISSHPSTSTSSSSSTPTPSTSRASYHVKKEMIMEKRRPRSHSNNPNDRASHSDRQQPQSDQRYRDSRSVRIGRRENLMHLFSEPIKYPGHGRFMLLKDTKEARLVDQSFGITDDRSVVINPVANKHESGLRNNHNQISSTIDDLRRIQTDRVKELKASSERSMKISQNVTDSRNNIDLPDIDMKDSFTDKPLTRDNNDKILEKPRLIKKIEPEIENISDKSKDVKNKIEKQSTNENRRISSEPSTENSRNPININKTNGTGIRGTSLLALHGLTGNENEHIKAPHPIPQRLNLPEKRKANEIQGSGFVLNKPTELTEETAKLLKDSNGAKKLKLVLFERACKAESLLPAETSIWTTEDVFNFIRFIGFPDAADNFLDHQIDGKSLLLLSRRDVLAGFKLKLGPALKIYAHIFRLQRKRPALLLED